MRKIVISLFAVAVFVAGCGGGDSKSSTGGSSTPVALPGNTTNKGTKDISGTTVELEADDFYFSPTFLKGGTPGTTITIKVKNEGTNPHTFTSSALGVDETIAAGESKDISITLPQSGATEFHCKFHQASNGMQGAFFFKDGDAVAGGAAGNTGTSSSSDYQNPYN